MEPEGSLPRLQESATCPCPEPAQSSPCPSIPLPECPSQYYSTIYAWVFQMVSVPLSCLHQNPGHPSIYGK